MPYEKNTTYQPLEYPNKKIIDNYYMCETTVPGTKIHTHWRLSIVVNNENTNANAWNEVEQSYQKLSIDKNDFYIQWSNAIDLIIKNDHIESCCESILEIFLKESFDKYKETGLSTEFIIKYFKSNIKNVHKVVSILHALGHLPYEIVEEAGFTIASMCLNNRNIEIVEHAIKAFENWNTIDSVDYLESVNTECMWLGDYLKGVIDDIKESNSIC